jgi:hypothetical protein
MHIGDIQTHSKAGWVTDQGHGRHVLDGREMPRDHHRTLPNGERKALVSPEINQKAASPYKRSCSFAGCGHDGSLI